ncbi:hypothetical protein FOPE_04155 [Fonsecaea pedrosoi]|nr:hypothetical protein FOPE_04155 [Fonsecaea pedrosoi]
MHGKQHGKRQNCDNKAQSLTHRLEILPEQLLTSFVPQIVDDIVYHLEADTNRILRKPSSYSTTWPKRLRSPPLILVSYLPEPGQTGDRPQWSIAAGWRGIRPR